MVILKNPRHEAFARALAEGISATDAYAAAGYRSSESNACHLTRNHKVQARLEELQQRAAERTAVTIGSLTEELESVRQRAMKRGQSAAAVAAIMGKAKLHGLGRENRKLSGAMTIATITPEQWARLTDEELDLLQSLVEKLGTSYDEEVSKAWVEATPAVK